MLDVNILLGKVLNLSELHPRYGPAGIYIVVRNALQSASEEKERRLLWMKYFSG
jgi:hypothetical protein